MMSKLFDKINKFFTAKTWSGASWLLSLCCFLIALAGVYIWVHQDRDRGREYIQLNAKQIQGLNNILSVYPDSGNALLKNDTARRARAQRDSAVIEFLQSEYRNKVDSLQVLQLRAVISRFDNKDIGNYLTSKNIVVQSVFWLIGSDVYLEAWLWSLFGVLVSLIYYVSLAYSKSLSITGDDDTGKFDPAELPSQIGKMFYAPACTIVIVLGYHFLSTSGSNMIDINVNKGLIIFSFISGFFSGRLMKFLDKLKDLFLPVTETTNSNTATVPAKADATVQLTLSEALKQSPDVTAIIEAGFNAATVTLTPEGGGDAIELENPADDQADVFTGKQLNTGKYVLQAALTYKKDEDTVINMTGKQMVEIKANQNEFTVALDKTEAEG
jgi:hypothetical protein